MPREVDHLFLTADVVGVDVSSGEVRLKLGDAFSARGFAQEVPSYGPDGFIGCPSLPDAEGNAAQACYYQDGDQYVCVGVRDNRIAEKAGSLEPGDRAIITDGPARVLVKNGTSTIALYTESEVEAVPGTGKGIIFAMSGEDSRTTIRCAGCEFSMGVVDGSPEITMTASNGAQSSSIRLSAARGLEVEAPGINLDSPGFVTIGLVGGTVRPVVGAMSAVVGPVGMTAVGAAKVAIALA